MICVEELCDVPVVIFPRGEPVEMIVVVANIKASSLCSSHEQTFRIVVKPFLSRVLYDKATVIVFVLSFTEFDDSVHHVVLHWNCITPYNINIEF